MSKNRNIKTKLLILMFVFTILSFSISSNNMIIDSKEKEYTDWINYSIIYYQASSHIFGKPNLTTTTLKNYNMIPGYSYNWIDATVAGSRCTMNGADNAVQYISLPFVFPFYDGTYNYIYICSNGFVGFVSSTAYNNVAFPSSTYKLRIAPYWDDLKTANPCNIYYKSLTSPNRFVIEYKDIYTLTGFLVGTFEIVLYENGNITFNYNYLNRATSYTCGLNYGYNLNYYSSYSGLTNTTTNFSIFFNYTSTPAYYLPPPFDSVSQMVLLLYFSNFNSNSRSLFIGEIIAYVTIPPVIISIVFGIKKYNSDSHSRHKKIEETKSRPYQKGKSLEKREDFKIQGVEQYRKIGDNFVSLGNYQKAIEFYEKAVRINPLDVTTRTKLDSLRTKILPLKQLNKNNNQETRMSKTEISRTIGIIKPVTPIIKKPLEIDHKKYLRLSSETIVRDVPKIENLVIKNGEDLKNKINSLKKNSIIINKIGDFDLGIMYNLDAKQFQIFSQDMKEIIERLPCNFDDKLEILKEISKLPRDIQKRLIFALESNKNS